MILIDTSIWIEFFKQNSDYIEEIQALLEGKLVITIEPVFAELLYGVRNQKEKEIIQSFWRILPKIGYDANSMLEAAKFANSRDYHQLGIGLMDAIIIKSALDGDHLLWTLDERILRNVKIKYIYQSS